MQGVRRGKCALVVVGSWQRRRWSGELHVNWSALGFDRGGDGGLTIRQLDWKGRLPRSLPPREALRVVVFPRDGVLLQVTLDREA